MYKALYSKWRPRTWSDVIGQETITGSLRNQVRTGKTVHAYLFTGSRGTGKTSCARILAKAVNCLSPDNGSPCLECDVCKSAEKNTLSDIFEIDAASNNGVDDARALRETAVYSPERLKYRVYIIDEVHALTKEAFNALLKIIEEPPPHIKFILATTELHKVPATILSRCQRHDFCRITAGDIASRLMRIADAEGISLEETAAHAIAMIADGGMRDAVSLLDQCAAYGTDVTPDVVNTVSGTAGREYVFDIIKAVVGKNPAAAIEVIGGLHRKSKDMQRLCSELILQFRNIMIIKASPDNKNTGKNGVIECMPHEEEILRSISSEINSINEVFYYLDCLRESSERLSHRTDKRIEMEMTAVRLCLYKFNGNSEKSLDNSDIYAKILSADEIAPPPVFNEAPEPVFDAELMQNQESAGNSVREQTAAHVKNEIREPVPVSEKNEAKDPPAAPVKNPRPEDFRPLALWAEILREFQSASPAVSGTLQGSAAFVCGNIILISARNSFFLQLFKQPENKKLLSDTITKVLGQAYNVRVKIQSGSQNTAPESPAQKTGNMPDELIEKAKQAGIDVAEDE